MKNNEHIFTNRINGYFDGVKKKKKHEKVRAMISAEHRRETLTSIHSWPRSFERPIIDYNREKQFSHPLV